MSVTIPKYVLEKGEDVKVSCQICGKKSNILIKKNNNSIKPSSVTKGGTVITDSGDIQKRIVFKLIISNKHTGQTVAIKEISSGKTYILGRSADKIKQENAMAVPILIPPNFDAAVSRSHFELKVQPNNSGASILIRDLNSVNKTWLENSNDIKEILEANEQVYIDIKDKITIGENTSITFSSYNL